MNSNVHTSLNRSNNRAAYEGEYAATVQISSYAAVHIPSYSSSMWRVSEFPTLNRKLQAAQCQFESKSVGDTRDPGQAGFFNHFYSWYQLL